MAKRAILGGIVVLLAMVAAILVIGRWTGEPRDRDDRAAEQRRDDRMGAAADDDDRGEQRAAEGAPASESVRGRGALVLTIAVSCGPAPFDWPELEIRDTSGDRELRVPAEPSLRVEGLEPGRWSVDVLGHAWANEPVLVDVVADRDVPLALALEPRSIYQGLLLDAGTRTPIERAEVEPIWKPAGRAPSHWVSWPAVDIACPGGRFCLTGPIEEAETVQFRFLAPGYRSTLTAWLPGASGTLIDGLIVNLEPRTLVRMRGSVIDVATREGVEGAVVCAVAADLDRTQVFLAGGDVQFAGMHPSLAELAESGRSSSADARGSWTLDVDAPARLRVLAVARGYRVAMSEVLELSAAREGPEVNLVLEPGGLLKGRVIDAPEDDGLVAIAVELAGAAGLGGASCALADDGAFEIGGLDAGRYVLSVLGELSDALAGFPTLVLASEEVNVSVGLTEIDVHVGEARPGRSVRGRVVLPASASIRTVIAAACAPPDVAPPCAITVAGPDGTFALHGIPQEAESLVLVLDGLGADRRDRAFTVVELDPRAAAVDPPRIDASSSLVEIECGASASVRAGERLRIEAVTVPGVPAWFPLALSYSLSARLEFEPGARYRLFGLPVGSYRLVGEGVDVSFTAGDGAVRVLVD